MNFDNCENLTNKSLVVLAEEIKLYFSALEHLAISFNGCSNIKDKGFQTLTEAFMEKLNLRHLGLGFPGGLSIEGLKFVVDNLKMLKSQLTYLNFCFRSCFYISDANIQYLAESLGPFLGTINRLGLIFENCPQVSINSFKAISTFIFPNLTYVKSLDLFCKGFSKVNIDNEEESFINLNAALSEISTNIEFLVLSLPCHQNITNKCIKMLVKSIKKLDHLQVLKLDFSRCDDMGDEGMQELGKAITEICDKLTTLHLCFQGCSKLTDKSLNGFSFATKSEKISNNKTIELNLKELYLDFHSSSDAMIKGIRNLFDNFISYFKKLNFFIMSIGSIFLLEKKGENIIDEIGDSIYRMSQGFIEFSNCQE